MPGLVEELLSMALACLAATRDHRKLRRGQHPRRDRDPVPSVDHRDRPHQLSEFVRLEVRALVEQVMSSEPYASARTVFWIVDNGSSHAGKASIRRLEGAWENLRLIHLPIHASWLNQIELYFSIVQTQSADAQRVRFPRRTRPPAPALRRPLPPDRPALRLDLHPHRPRRRPRQDHRARTQAHARGLTRRTSG